MSVQNELASLNAIGNGAIGGSFGDGGQTTGLLVGLGADISMDATNPMGSASGSGSDRYEMVEEPGDFTGSRNAPGNKFNCSMGSARLAD